MRGLPPASFGTGIHQIPLPLPFRSPAFVNSYLIEDGDGLLLLDCGVEWQPGRAALEEGFRLLGLDPASVHTLVVTHLHVDHVGMAPRLRAEHGWRLVMHRRAAALVDRYNDTAGFAKRTRALADRHGAPEPEAKALGDIGPRPDFMPPMDPPDHLLDDGNIIDLGGERRLEVLYTPGHEPAHICLRESQTGVLFAGDHVLPGITPVVMYDEEVDDALGDYLASLRRIGDLQVELTYPAHGGSLERGSARAEQIILHHHRRLDQMHELASLAPMTAWSIMGRVFRPHLSILDQRLALRETVSHLEHLRLSGRLEALAEDGVLYYRAR